MATGRTSSLSRRDALAVMGGAAALAAGCRPSAVGPPTPPQPASAPVTQSIARMPAVFLPHGGGPWPFMDDRVFGQPGMWNDMRAYMEGLGMTLPGTPEAIVVVSAHWEAPVPTVMSAAHPPMLYDYYGFPEETYHVEWPAPGAPELAADIRDALDNAGIASAADAERGFDHGVFVPLKLTYPEAAIPTLQVSLKHGLDPAEHHAIGRALAPLRDRGVLLVGSGMSYHNLRALMGNARGAGGSPTIADDSRAFDEWLAEAVTSESDRRHTALVEWERAPAARACHPREEHLLPLMVVAGAAGDDAATLPYRDVVMGAHVSAVHFG